ncbi:hypothetical protein F52700_2473 [Fusarium sp. NRRL 52700]|nr:hypothetical protein F52700_2473 [Fusarium sp. NRRL 52700]
MSMVPSKRPALSASSSTQAKSPGRSSDEAAERLPENARSFQHDNVDQVVGEVVQTPGEGWSEALTVDDLAQIRCDIEGFNKRLRDSEKARDRLFEEAKADQAETQVVFREQVVQDLEALQSEYTQALEGLNSECVEALEALKSENSAAIESVKSQCDEQASLIKSLQEELERLRQSR